MTEITILGIKILDALAGAVGSFVGVSMDTQNKTKTRIQVGTIFISGWLCSLFLAPPLSSYLEHNFQTQISSSAAGFFVGMLGLSLAKAIVTRVSGNKEK